MLMCGLSGKKDVRYEMALWGWQLFPRPENKYSIRERHIKDSGLYTTMFLFRKIMDVMRTRSPHSWDCVGL